MMAIRPEGSSFTEPAEHGRGEGSVFLGGGGSPDDERDVWTWAHTGVERVLYWPFALAGNILATADEWFRGSLASIDLHPEVVTWTTLQGRRSDELDEFDLLHVGGGNTFRLLDHIRRHEFFTPVRDFVRRGGDYYGGSAGAVIACADIEIAASRDPNDVGLVDLGALALIPSYSVLPHHDGNVTSPLSWASERNRAVIAVPERGGLHHRLGTFTAIGPDLSMEITSGGMTPRPPGSSWLHRAR
ncbi:Type 1 glutamine amidotransferase-like domain-containing protein [Nakamurella sp. A5-74]|uniref:Type 1 glutamine amidotransferase-like domain-containing protein n=1 Tax=Nakamurella sp. A5-74 TaxID=3158264 RepID=A0AAU8DW60_9ACTN